MIVTKVTVIVTGDNIIFIKAMLTVIFRSATMQNKSIFAFP